jgi:ribA/ribD-fused uncharacterized protein
MSAEELKRFYKARVKKPELYTYDEDGNLVELNKEGSVIKTIPLPDYRPPSFEEFDKMEQSRLEAITIANKEFEDSRRELRTALSNPETTDSEVLRINRKVKEADIKLENVRFPLTQVSKEDGISINQVDFEKTYEKRKYPYNFFFLEERPYTLQDQYVRIGKIAPKPLKSVAELKTMADIAPVVILFQDPETNDYGFLSLKWTVEIEFNGTMYNSAHQVISAELAKAFNDQEGLRRIMMADTPNEVIYRLDNVPGDAEANETKWNDITKQLIYDINIAKFNQYPELASRLLETKNAMLGAYVPDDNLIGIGISLDNVQSKNPINWTGQNILGKALMDIRQNLRDTRELAVNQATIAPSQPIASTNTSIAIQPVVDKTSIGPIPRPVRRRPKPAVAVTTTSQAE